MFIFLAIIIVFLVAVKNMGGLCQCLLLLFMTSLPIQAEIYTALVDMEELLESEALLLRTLEDYITAQDRRLQLIKKFVTVITNE